MARLVGWLAGHGFPHLAAYLMGRKLARILKKNGIEGPITITIERKDV